jgi:hypothetical protein
MHILSFEKSAYRSSKIKNDNGKAFYLPIIVSFGKLPGGQ